MIKDKKSLVFSKLFLSVRPSRVVRAGGVLPSTTKEYKNLGKTNKQLRATVIFPDFTENCRVTPKMSNDYQFFSVEQAGRDRTGPAGPPGTDGRTRKALKNQTFIEKPLNL